MGAIVLCGLCALCWAIAAGMANAVAQTFGLPFIEALGIVGTLIAAAFTLIVITD